MKIFNVQLNFNQNLLTMDRVENLMLFIDGGHVGLKFYILVTSTH